MVGVLVMTRPSQSALGHSLPCSTRRASLTWKIVNDVNPHTRSATNAPPTAAACRTTSMDGPRLQALRMPATRSGSTVGGRSAYETPAPSGKLWPNSPHKREVHITAFLVRAGHGLVAGTPSPTRRAGAAHDPEGRLRPASGRKRSSCLRRSRARPAAAAGVASVRGSRNCTPPPNRPCSAPRRSLTPDGGQGHLAASPRSSRRRRRRRWDLRQLFAAARDFVRSVQRCGGHLMTDIA